MKQTPHAGMPPSVPREAEVWLRGNARPAVAVAAVMASVAAMGLVIAAALRPAPWVMAVVAALCLADVAVAAGVVWAAWRPRLVRRGAVLEVRLAPLRMERVPIEAVECVFPGSLPLGGDDETADRRVGTLVLRLAERATEWRSRPAAVWGMWEEGSIVFDGRWCEPLSQAVARDLSGRLLEARRQVVAETAT